MPFDADLPRDVFATILAVGGKPVSGGGGSLVLVGGAIHGEQIVRVIAEAVALGGGPVPGTGLPGVCERHDVVDLHGGAGVSAAHEQDGLPGVGVGERTRGDLAALGCAEYDISQVAGEHIVAHVAAVAIIVGGAESE